MKQQVFIVYYESKKKKKRRPFVQLKKRSFLFIRLFRTSVPNIRKQQVFIPMFLALVEVFSDFRRQIRIQHVELL